MGHGETVSNFAAAKYGTVLIFDLTFQILWLRNMGPFLIYPDMCFDF